MKKVLHRFVDVWKIDFLAKFFAGEYRDTRTTIFFWLLSNIVIACVFTIQIVVMLSLAQKTLVAAVQQNVHDGATVNFQDGQMTMINVDDPFFREITAKNDKGSSTSSVIIIDQKADTYDLNALDEYAGGVILLHDRAYVKDGSDITQVLYTDVPNFSLSKEQLLAYIDQYYIFPIVVGLSLFAGVFLTFFMLLIRTIGALWWSLMLYVIGVIMDVRMTYVVAYKSVLNLYFVPLTVATLLTIFGVHIPFLTTAIFVAVFIANLLWHRNHTQREDVAVQQESVHVPKTEEV